MFDIFMIYGTLGIEYFRNIIKVLNSVLLKTRKYDLDFRNL